MRRFVAALICPVVVAAIAAAVAGCGSNSAPETAPAAVTSTDALRGLFQQAQSQQKTVTTVAKEEGDPQPTTLTCKVQLAPTKESDCSSPGKNGDFRTISLPDAVYIYSADPTSQIDGKPWRKLDNADRAHSASVGAQTKDLGDDALFAAGVAKIAKTTPDQVNGHPALRYDLDVDAKALFSAMLAPSADDALRAASQQIINSGGTAGAQVWIGPNNLPLQTVTHISMPGKQTRSETTTYSDWGKSVDIQAPPANQVATS